MLNGAKPFVVAHDAQSEHFSTSGTVATFTQFFGWHELFGFRQQKHILDLSILSIFPLECKRKIQSKQPSRVYDWLQDMDILDL